MTTATQENDGRRFLSPPFRLSFAHLLVAQTDETTGRISYNLNMLYPPDTDMAPFKKALTAAMVKKFGPDRSKWPNIKRKPSDVIRDAGAYNQDRVLNKKQPLEGYEPNWKFVRASAIEKNKPHIVGPVRGADGKFPVITDERDLYPGRWARATLEAYYYPKQGGGVTFSVGNVQLLKHDKALGGSITRAEEDFTDQPEAMDGDDFDKGANAAGTGKPATSDGDDW